MKEEIKIPPLGESINEVTIGTLLKSDGSRVKENEEIVELETEKVNQVLNAPVTGVLSWKVTTGANSKIGDVIGFVDTEGVPKEEKPIEKPASATSPPPPPPPKEEGTRHLKEEFISDLKQPVQEEKQEEVKKSEERETRKKMSKIRKVIAARLVESLRTSAMLTTFNEVDMSVIIELRARYKESFVEKHGVKLGFMSFFVKAVVDALAIFPDFNSYIDKDEIVHREYFDIGIAIGGGKGLVVPVLRDCDKLSFAEIEKRIGEYAIKARSGKLSLDEIQGGGFTITNGGVYGSLLSTPLLNPPQSGILGMHKIEKRVVVVNDEIVIRPMMYLALSYDHRLIDGKDAILFLVKVKEILEDPSRLMFLE